MTRLTSKHYVKLYYRNQLLSKIFFIKIIIYEINANPITRLILCNIKYD